ncbi:hypothetical protein Tcan_00548, partial [Toxocara canis]
MCIGTYNIIRFNLLLIAAHGNFRTLELAMKPIQKATTTDIDAFVMKHILGLLIQRAQDINSLERIYSFPFPPRILQILRKYHVGGSTRIPTSKEVDIQVNVIHKTTFLNQKKVKLSSTPQIARFD